MGKNKSGRDLPAVAHTYLVAPIALEPATQQRENSRTENSLGWLCKGSRAGQCLDGQGKHARQTARRRLPGESGLEEGHVEGTAG